MQIIVNPNDIIQRCLFDKYKKFCLFDKTDSEIEKIVEDNKPISLSENDAYVIGLLKIIETDNLVHRFNEDIIECIQIKSNVINDELYINKSSIRKFVTNYLDKFPSYYKPPLSYRQGIDDLVTYVTNIGDGLDNLETIDITNKEKVYTYYLSKDVKKLLSF
jgi:hypothetical protein